MALGLTDAGSMRPIWLAFCPTFVLLGMALPVFFLTSIDTYLQYLRPFELIPTYGTAWLLLAMLAVPASLVSWLALSMLDQPSTRGIGSVVVLALLGIAAATIVVALGYGVLVWLRTFGLLVNRPVGQELIALSLCAGALVASMPAARAGLLNLFPLMRLGAGLGALSLVTLPFCGWEAEQAPSKLSNPPSAAASRSNPHILLITVDTLAAEHMSLYGAVRETTPRLEAFAREAITFDRAYANGNFTTPGISSILTGSRPWTHRALQLLSWPVREARRDSLPALLLRGGYQTGYVATNFVAGGAKNGFGSYFTFQSSDRVGFFSRCRDGLATVLRYHCAANILKPFALPRMLRQFIPHGTGKSANRQFDPQLAMRPALEWLAKAEKRTPIFLWVHFLPPHSPYAAPEPWLGQFDSSQIARNASDSETKFEFLFRRLDGERVAVLEARYDESVEYVDYYVGEYLKQALQLLGPNTAVVVTADHGESFAHGYGGHGGPGLFESLIHIPLVIKLPYQTRPIRTSVPAEQVDIAPTLASLAGMTPPASWEGRSLLPLVRDSESGVLLPAKPVFAMNFEENRSRSALTTGSVSVIDGRWKFVHFMGALHYPLMPQLHDELYDLSADPRELANRLPDEALEAQRLRELILRELAQRGAALP